MTQAKGVCRCADGIARRARVGPPVNALLHCSTGTIGAAMPTILRVVCGLGGGGGALWEGALQ